MYAQLGADVIGMTQFPEATLARELELCYGNVALVTDYDVGVDDIPPVTHEEVLKVFGENIDKLRDLLFAAIPEVPAERTCPCATALAGTGQRMMAGRTLVTVELRFVTDEDPGQLADRMREAVATIVGKDVARGVPRQDAPARTARTRRVVSVRSSDARHGGRAVTGLRSRAMLFRRKLPRSSFVLLCVSVACALAAAVVMRAYARRLDAVRPDGGPPVARRGRRRRTWRAAPCSPRACSRW